MPHTPGHTETPQGGTGAPPDEFELLRRRLKLRGASRGEEQQRDLNRRFAAAGNLPSGAAFKIRQQATEAAERQTSEDLQDVNVLQAQTQRQEREAAAGRELQRFGIETQAQSARDVETLRGQFGAEAQERAIVASRNELAANLASAKDLAQIDATTKQYLGDLDFNARMQQMQVSDATARHLGEMEIGTQLQIADWDKDLRSRGLDLQQVIANSNIEASQVEGQLNTFATFVNAMGPLTEAGFSDDEVADMVSALGIGFPEDEITKVIKRNNKASAQAKADQQASALARTQAREGIQSSPTAAGRGSGSSFRGTPGSGRQA